MLLTSLLFFGGGIAAAVSLSKQILSKNVKKTSSKKAVLDKKSQQELSLVSEHKDIIEIQAEKEINRYLVVSSTSLVLTTLGGLVYPLLTIVSIPLLIYGSGYILKKAYEIVIKERRIGAALLDVFAILGLAVTGSFFATYGTHSISIAENYYEKRKIIRGKISLIFLGNNRTPFGLLLMKLNWKSHLAN
ncbi:MAG: hypothetical protein KAI83_04635 [Thiomargarita sp.]|nr:hypothetical protein [Thiomargarita sp.]